MRIKRSKTTSGAIKLIRSLAVIVLLGASSLALAYVWQSHQEASRTAETDPGTPPGQNSWMATESQATPVEEQPAGQEDFLHRAGGGGGDTEDQGQEEDAASANRPAPAANAVPQSEKVGNSYFNDAIFFGDSVSSGITLYKVGGNPDTVAVLGLRPDTINSDELIATPEGNQTVLEAAQKYGEKKKVYIMLGLNGLWMEESNFVQGYQTFIGSVKERYPGATIYLQSILPVTEKAKENYPDADNETIRRFNGLIQSLARNNGIHYLDVASALMDDNGDLPAAASPFDGVHLTAEYYALWFEYLKTHTVAVK